MRQSNEEREQEEKECFERLAKEGQWDEALLELARQDKNREQRVQYHEVVNSDIADHLHSGRRQYGKPPSVREYNLSNIVTHPWEDIIFDNPDEIDQLLSDPVDSQCIQKLTDKQKQALFYRCARGMSVQNTAPLMDCKDRNVIKHIHAGAEKFQKKILPILKDMDEKSIPMTTNQRWFLQRLENPYHNRKLMKELLKSGKLEEWLEAHPVYIYTEGEILDGDQ